MNGLAAVNGGFFTPEGQPLGRVVASGKSTGSINRASSLGSGFYVEKNDRPALVRRQGFSGGSQALQAGPFLVENDRTVPGLGTKVSSARTFIATDGRHGWILARTGACSLADLATALTGATIGGIRLRSALNLDGGRSSEIWASGALPGGPAFTRPLWNKPVRNFLVLKSRH
ncbi:phosphodiester glycosidase family protein [Verrucomicrobiaceae bacterium E54]|nr:phosphodiester glycosidase family protein [Verrucomicrobiaceae bacterium E54]